MGVTPPKLVAKTWFNQEDLVYYLQNLAADKVVRILDFKELQELTVENSKKPSNAGHRSNHSVAREPTSCSCGFSSRLFR